MGVLGMEAANQVQTQGWVMLGVCWLQLSAAPYTHTHTPTRTHPRPVSLAPVRGIRTTATQSETIHKYINTCATPTNKKKKKNTNSKTDVLSLIHSLARSPAHSLALL